MTKHKGLSEYEVLELYKKLSLEQKLLEQNFDPNKLGEEYRNFTIYENKDYNYTTSSSSVAIENPW